MSEAPLDGWPVSGEASTPTYLVGDGTEHRVGAPITGHGEEIRLAEGVDHELTKHNKSTYMCPVPRVYRVI